jgi:hypothetical protein
MIYNTLTNSTFLATFIGGFVIVLFVTNYFLKSLNKYEKEYIKKHGHLPKKRQQKKGPASQEFIAFTNAIVQNENEKVQKLLNQSPSLLNESDEVTDLHLEFIYSRSSSGVVSI